MTVCMKGCILECGGVAPKQWFLHCQLLQQTDKYQQETKQLRHTKIQRLKAVEFARTCQTTLNIVNGMNKILHSGVRQATTSMMPTRIDPRMKRKSFLVDRLVCFLFGESNHTKKKKTKHEASKWQSLSASKFQVQVRFWSSWN